MKRFAFSGVASVLASPLLTAGIAIEATLPEGALISNPDLAPSGSTDGSSAVGVPVANDFFNKGQSFTISDSIRISSITVRIDESTADVRGTPLDMIGDVILNFYNMTGGAPDDTQDTGQIPTGDPIFSQTETLPATTPGDYLTLTLDSPLSLAAGVYAFTLVSPDTSESVLFRLDTNRQDTNGTNNVSYTEGEIVRYDSVVWQDRNFDLVFAISGTSTPAARLQFELVSAGANLTFTWPSQAGKVYDLLTSTDPESDGDPATWTAVTNQEDIAAIPPTNTLTIARPVDGKRFYVIREEDAPPPPPIFEDDFESGGTGWSTSNDGLAGTDWVLGDPTGGINNGPTAAFSPDNCYGTNILTDYQDGADVSLFSPVIAIPAGGATLRYQFWIDTETGPIPDPPDFGTLSILDADNGDALLETLEAEILGFPLAWDQAEYVLPASAYGKNVKFQFRFVSDTGGVNSNFGGWYIDDVTVTTD